MKYFIGKTWRSSSCSLLLALGTAVLLAPSFGPLTKGQSVKIESTPAGYLSIPPPMGLRFSTAPKPAVAQLPPLPITYDPQPVFNPDFVPSTTEIPDMTVGRSRLPPPEPFRDEVGPPPGSALPVVVQQPVPERGRAIRPDLLIHYFQELEDRPETPERALERQGAIFQPPVRPSSSAVYRQR